MIQLIGFDADDTLWENEHLYQQTEKKFRELLTGYQSEEHTGRELLTWRCATSRFTGTG